MFTGIIEETGKVLSINKGRLCIGAERILEDINTGDSVAINGACLTVVSLGPSTFETDLSEETITRTNFGDLQQGFHVNLERACHLVTELKQSGNYFIGKSKRESRWQSYMGSSKYLKEDIKKLGKKHFKFEVIDEFKNKRSLKYYELVYQVQHNVLTSCVD